MNLIFPSWFLLKSLNSLHELDLANMSIPYVRVGGSEYKVFLTKSQYKNLVDLKPATLSPLQNKSVLSDSTPAPTKFIVHATETWSNPKIKTFHKGFGYFIVANVNDTSILETDPEVFSFEPYLKIQFFTDFAAPYLLSGLTYDNDSDPFFMIPRTLNEKGLSGENQIISFIDTGIDIFSPFFYDPYFTDYTNFFNRDTLHRKIKFYNVSSNYTEVEYGHGTFITNVAAGKSLHSSNVSRFNGIAPNSKILFYDVYDANEKFAYDINYTEIFAKMNSYNSKVLCSPYGITNNFDTQGTYDQYIDEVHNNDSSILSVFSSGNTGRLYGVYQPCSSKNVLCVGSVDNLKASNIRHPNSRRTYILTSDGTEIDVDPIGTDVYTLIYNGTFPQNFVFDNDCANTSTGKACFSDTEEAIDFEPALIISGIYYNFSTNIPILQLQNSSESTLISTEFSIKFEVNLSGKPEISSFSSSGWTYMNRVKPDVVAPGSNIVSAKSGPIKNYTIDAPLPSNLTMTPEDSTAVFEASGTSISAGFVAGLCVLVQQYFKEAYYFDQSMNISSNLLRAIIINSAQSDSVYPQQTIG